jgi:hypothetical protein
MVAKNGKGEFYIYNAFQILQFQSFYVVFLILTKFKLKTPW